MKYCNHCGKQIAATTTKCPFCGEWLHQPAQSTQHPQSSPYASVVNNKKSKNTKLLIGICIGLALILIALIAFFIAQTADVVHKASATEPTVAEAGMESAANRETPTTAPAINNGASFAGETGMFKYRGDFIYNGKRYPVTLSLNVVNGDVRTGHYHNVNYGGDIHMRRAETSEDALFSLEGYDGSNHLLTITIDEMQGNTLRGAALNNGLVMDVELYPQ